MRTCEIQTMRNLFHLLIIGIFLLILMPGATSHAQGVSPDGEIESGAVVCAPGVYLEPPGDCLPLGPSSYLTDLARKGLTFPERPLPVSKPDKELVALPYL